VLLEPGGSRKEDTIHSYTPLSKSGSSRGRSNQGLDCLARMCYTVCKMTTKGFALKLLLKKLRHRGRGRAKTEVV